MSRTVGKVPVSTRENKLSLQMNAWMHLSFIRESLGLDPLSVETKGGPGFAQAPAAFRLSWPSSAHLPGEALLCFLEISVPAKSQC